MFLSLLYPHQGSVTRFQAEREILLLVDLCSTGNSGSLCTKAAMHCRSSRLSICAQLETPVLSAQRLPCIAGRPGCRSLLNRKSRFSLHKGCRALQVVQVVDLCSTGNPGSLCTKAAVHCTSSRLSISAQLDTPVLSTQRLLCIAGRPGRRKASLPPESPTGRN